MSVPGKVPGFQLRQDPCFAGHQGRAAQWVPNSTRSRPVTDAVRLGGGRVQAIPQGKRWSPEITIIPEADPVHVRGRQHGTARHGQSRPRLAGSESIAWIHGSQGNLGELWRGRKTEPLGMVGGACAGAIEKGPGILSGKERPSR